MQRFNVKEGAVEGCRWQHGRRGRPMWLGRSFGFAGVCSGRLIARSIVRPAGQAILIAFLIGVVNTSVASGSGMAGHSPATGVAVPGAGQGQPSRDTSNVASQPGTDDGLLLSTADVPGYSVSSTGASQGRKAVAGKLPSRLRNADVQGVAFKSPKASSTIPSRRLTVGVFLLKRPSLAKDALRSLAKGRKPAKAGTGGLILDASTKKVTDVAVVFRNGSAVGAVRLQTPVHWKNGPASTTIYAQTLDDRLTRVLGLTAFQRTLDAIHTDGSVTPQIALQTFSIVYGPLPGVKHAPGPGAPPSATIAMQMVARVWNQLGSAQQAAIDHYIGAPHDAKSPQTIRRADTVLTPSPHYTALANKYNAIYHARISGVPTVTIQAFTAAEDITTGSGGKAFADATPLNKDGEWGVGAPAYCRIRVTPTGRAQGTEFQELVMAHEAFHCIEFVLMTDWRERSDWIIEGMADWAAVTVDPVPVAVGGNSYKSYLSTPETPLFARAYSATGFWGHADEAGGKGSLWAKIPAILGASDDPTSFALAGGTQSGFVDTWASAPWRLSYRGAAWNQTDPYQLPDTEFPGFLPSAVAGTSAVNSAPYALKEIVVFGDPDNPLVYIQRGMGSLRAGDAKTDLGTIGGSQWFCFQASCKCPAGQTSTIPAHKTVTNDQLDLALTGGNYTGAAVFAYHSLDEFCDQKSTGGIMVYQNSVNGGKTVVATFKTAACRKTAKGKKPAQFTASSTSGSYKLSVGIKKFAGYHNYPLDWRSTDPSFTVEGPGGPFSNLYWPGGTPPNHGGYITFSSNGGVMGLGFIDAWNNDFSDDIVIAGTATCKYSTKG